MGQMKTVLIFFSALSCATGILNYNDAKCDQQLNQFDDALVNRELWAVKLFDLWAKIPSGWLHGNRRNPGHFTECVKFRHDAIQGQHCMVDSAPTSSSTLEPNDQRFNWQEIGQLARENNFNFQQGMCLPATCSPEKAVEYSNKFLHSADLEAFHAICRTNDPVTLQAIDYIAFTVLGLLILLVASSTVYEIVMIRKNGFTNKLLAAFSLYTNGAKLFDVTENKSPNVINCLNGIRTLSIFWIIFGHRFNDRDMIPVFNLDDSAGFRQNILYLVYTNYDKPVDTFFLIGGLLVTWSLLDTLEKKTTNIPRMYLHRYLRYTPSLAVVILFYMSFTKFLGSGPFFNPMTENCEKNWWTALLHVSVYTNPFTPCYDISWYLAVDFQLFLISPLLIYPLWRWGKKFFWVLPVLVVLVQGCIFTTTYKHEIMVYFFAMQDLDGMIAWISKFYYPTHQRLGAWVVGIMLGYFMYHTRGNKVKLNKFVDAALWILSFSVLLSIVLGLYPFQQLEDNQTTRLGNSLYNTCFRVMWAYAVGWIIFACHNGSGGIVRWFLSLKQWQPLGRMGLSIYLVHRFYQIVTFINEKQPIYWSFFGQLQKFYADVLVSIFLGACLYLAVEVPIQLIENYIHKMWRKKEVK